MLVLDASKGHLTPEMKATITGVSTKHALPSRLQGIASKLQSLNVVNKPFTDQTNSYTWCGYKIIFFRFPVNFVTANSYNYKVMQQTVRQ